LSKKAKLRNSVVALRAVDVMLMVRAPKFLVMAALHEDPKNPIVEKRQMTPILAATLQVLSSMGRDNSLYVPGWLRNTIPSYKSPLKAAAAVMATRAIEYMRNINSS
jgi:hypothetical protein